MRVKLRSFLLILFIMHATLLVACASNQRMIIIYTNDEHGWIDSSSRSGGAAALFDAVRTEREGDTSAAFLILSGGDNWTGPAISTLTKGAPVVEAFNAIGYSASAIGNHEFDFGLETMRQNFSECSFPHLAANIRARADSSVPEFIKPYIIKEVKGIKFGIIGLTTLETPSVAMEKNVGPFVFLPYEAALAEFIPKMKKEGAQVLIAICHICSKELKQEYAALAESYGIDFLLGGHCHDVLSSVGNTAVMETGNGLANYGFIAAEFNSSTGKVESKDLIIKKIGQGAPENPAKAIVRKWKAKTDALLGEKIGYAERNHDLYDFDVTRLILSSWLRAFPQAQIAMSNHRGFRQGIPQGDITVGTVYGILPFENDLYMVKLTGTQIVENIDKCGPDVFGLAKRSGKWYLSGGAELLPSATYRVVVNSFIYSGGDKFVIEKYDPAPVKSTVNSRAPFIDFLRETATTKERPIESLIRRD